MPLLWKRAIPVAATAAIVAKVRWLALVMWTFRPPTPSPTINSGSPCRFHRARHSPTATGDTLQFSPDGTQMVYVANARLYLRSMSDLEARPIPGDGMTGACRIQSLSPDGRFIAYADQDRTLKRISTSGGAAVTICPATDPYGMSWGADGITFRSSLTRW